MRIKLIIGLIRQLIKLLPAKNEADGQLLTLIDSALSMIGQLLSWQDKNAIESACATLTDPYDTND